MHDKLFRLLPTALRHCGTTSLLTPYDGRCPTSSSAYLLPNMAGARQAAPLTCSLIWQVPDKQFRSLESSNELVFARMLQVAIRVPRDDHVMTT